MNLRELIDYKLDIKKEKLIGRELMIADKPVLLLGLQEVRNEDAYYYRLENGSDSEEDEYITILYVLYEDEPEDEDWYEDEIEEPGFRSGSVSGRRQELPSFGNDQWAGMGILFLSSRTYDQQRCKGRSDSGALA